MKKVFVNVFVVRQQLTNVRIAKDSRAILSVTPTKGNFKLSNLGGRLLGLSDGDYIQIINQAEPGETPIIYISKGVENEKGVMKGAKVAFVNGNLGSAIQFGANAAYAMMGGKPTSNIVYTISNEPEEAENGVNWYLVTKDSEVNKQSKVRKNSEEEGTFTPINKRKKS